MTGAFAPLVPSDQTGSLNIQRWRTVGRGMGAFLSAAAGRGEGNGVQIAIETTVGCAVRTMAGDNRSVRTAHPTGQPYDVHLALSRVHKRHKRFAAGVARLVAEFFFKAAVVEYGAVAQEVELFGAVLAEAEWFEQAQGAAD